MKAVVFCLFALALVAQADVVNWNGKWLAESPLGFDASCFPGGVLEITQGSDSKAAFKGKWNTYTTACKNLKLAGETIDVKDIAVQDSSVSFTVKSKTDTPQDVTVTLTRLGTTNTMTVKVADGVPGVAEAELVNDDDLKKIKDFAGSYSFSLAEGDTAKCCLPDSLEISSVDNGLFSASGKWTDSQACKDKKVGGGKWEKVSASTIKADNNFGFEWDYKPAADLNVVSIYGTDPKDSNFGPQLMSSINGLEKCKVSVKKTSSGSKWWVWALIIGAIILVVGGIVGFVMYKKKNQRTGGHEYLKA